ncbi:MAG: hypothetical protein IAI49_14840, partial [Candidatus Eremiobacteraeota bacterium]|nr:hypothetical protein [Candidatus Eremiobacteraeota bacterium]
EPARVEGRPAASPLGLDPSPPPGSVRVVGALHYRIDSAKLEALDGVAAYHLSIRAIADPGRCPLTDLWIEPGSYAIRRVRGTFSDLYGSAAATIVGTGDFRRFGNAWVLVREHVDFEAATSPHPTHATLDATAGEYAFPEAPPPGLP